MEWIFECDLAEYDVHTVVKENETFEWDLKNVKNINIDDTVYIYVTDPEKAIRYKCNVVDILKVHEPPLYEAWYLKNNEDTVCERYVELELIEEYPLPGITLNELREHGIKQEYSFQSKRRVPLETLEFIEKRGAELIKSEGPDFLGAEDINTFPGVEREAIIKVRVNQSRYRKDLLKKYDRCALCGVTNKGLLIASHIKPWSECDKDEEKTDIDNGLMLCPNHDSLFDKGLISFDRNGNIVISDLLSPEDRMFLNVNENMHIELTGRMVSYMAYHLKYIFKSGKLK